VVLDAVRRDRGGVTGTAEQLLLPRQGEPRERDAARGRLPCRAIGTYAIGTAAEANARRQSGANPQPAVKPLGLVRWIVRVAVPPGALVVHPSGGSGATGCAVVLECFRFVGIEREAAYAVVARAHNTHWTEAGTQAREGTRLEPGRA
jgi:DNA modification methylase